MKEKLKTYQVEVVETLSRVVEQEGTSYEDARGKVETRYSDEEIVLDWNDLEKTEYKEYPSPKMKEDFIINIDFDKNMNDVYISTESSSGATYKCKTLEDLKIAINEYLDNYIQLENEKEIQNNTLNSDETFKKKYENIIYRIKEMERKDRSDRIKLGKQKSKEQKDMER